MADRGFIKRLKKGEDQAFKELVFSYSAKLLTTARVYCYNKREAEDILQDSFIVIFQKLKSFRGKKEEELLYWMRKIVMNKAFNRNRNFQVRNEKTVGEYFEDIEISPDALSKLSYNEIMDMVLGLPDGYRQVFALNVIEGYSHKEIANLLNISVSGSRAQLSRAKKSLQLKFTKLSKISCQ